MTASEEIKDLFIADGISDIGFSVLPEPVKELPNAITLVMKMNDSVIDEIEETPTYAYYHLYRTVNTFLDMSTLKLCELLRRRGFKSFAVASSQSVHDQKDKYTGVFQHKTAAVLSGLGFIGKSALFIHKDMGSRVRLATVLTDMPVPPAEVMTSKCGSCTVCQKLCPSGAILGKEYIQGMPRSEIFDAQKCSEHMKDKYKNIGRGAVCGICVSKCAYNGQKESCQK